VENEHASDTLEEIEPHVQRDIISSLNKERVVKLLNEMTPGQAADVLAILPSADAHMILDSMNKENAKKIQAIIGKQEEKVIHYTTHKILRFPPDTLVELLLVVIDLKELLQADDQARLKDIMVENVICLSTESTLKEASQSFARYDFRAIPVTDDNNRLFGVIPYRDVMNLTHHFVE
jgi:Mg/Co/Ni transporter MgtE